MNRCRAFAGICLLALSLTLAGCGKQAAVADSVEILTEAAEKSGTAAAQTEAATASAGTTAASCECTISITCGSILDNRDKVKDSYTLTLAGNGTILSPETVSFTSGETVFDVLSRACRNAGIQLEYSFSPLYGSNYIEGINNIYEFDAGDDSGWIYKVNGWAPNYGCSSYILEDGDTVEWVYTCDRGSDVGAGY